MPDAGIDRVLIAEDEIARTVRRLGREITACYSGIDRELVVVGLLRGSFVFMADLIRAIRLPLVVDFISVSTYGDGTISSGELKMAMDLEQSIEDRDVLLVEDIVDTGHTFNHVIRMMLSRRPRSLKVCTFLDKPSRRTCARGPASASSSASRSTSPGATIGWASRRISGTAIEAQPASRPTSSASAKGRKRNMP